jgi:endonuclease G
VPVIPDAFFLIVVDREEASGALRSLAFLVPHEESPKNDPKRYLTSIDAIEQATGLNFFSRLPETAQAALEARVAKTAW